MSRSTTLSPCRSLDRNPRYDPLSSGGELAFFSLREWCQGIGRHIRATVSVVQGFLLRSVSILSLFSNFRGRNSPHQGETTPGNAGKNDFSETESLLPSVRKLSSHTAWSWCSPLRGKSQNVFERAEKIWVGKVARRDCCQPGKLWRAGPF